MHSSPYRWWTLGIGFGWLKLGPVSFTWGPWFNLRPHFQIDIFNRPVLRYWPDLPYEVPQRYEIPRRAAKAPDQ